MIRAEHRREIQEVANTLRACADQLSDAFRSDSLLRLADCLDRLSARREFMLAFPLGEVRLWSADGGCFPLPDIAGATGGRVEIEPGFSPPRHACRRPAA